MDFDAAVEIVIEIEGGSKLVDDPDDPGGLTRWGISLRSHPELGRDGIINLSKEDAKEIYLNSYWNKLRLDEFPDKVRLAIFDSAVNQGQSEAVKILQRALGINADGVIGTQTLVAANKMEQKRLSVNFLNGRLFTYISANKFNKYGHGWAARLFQIALEMG